MPEESKTEPAAPQTIVFDNTPLDKALAVNKRRKFIQNVVNSMGMKVMATAILLVALFSSTFAVAYNKVQEQQAKAALEQIPKAEIILPQTTNQVLEPTIVPVDGIEEAKFCGGIANIQCEEGYQCKLDGNYPDAGGTCIRN